MSTRRKTTKRRSRSRSRSRSRTRYAKRSAYQRFVHQKKIEARKMGQQLDMRDVIAEWNVYKQEKGLIPARPACLDFGDEPSCTGYKNLKNQRMCSWYPRASKSPCRSRYNMRFQGLNWQRFAEQPSWMSSGYNSPMPSLAPTPQVSKPVSEMGKNLEALLKSSPISG